MGEDYADDDLAGVDVLLDNEKYAVTVEDVDENCCRPVKTKCQADAHGQKCFKKEGKVVCNEGKITCQKLKDYVSKKAKKQKEEDKIGEESKKKDNKNSEEYNDESVEDSYEDSTEEKKETVGMKNVKSKHVKDLKPSDLIKLVKKMNKPQK